MLALLWGKYVSNSQILSNEQKKGVFSPVFTIDSISELVNNLDFIATFYISIIWEYLAYFLLINSSIYSKWYFFEYYSIGKMSFSYIS